MSTQHERAALVCNFCGHKFIRTIRSATQEIRCPKCREYDIEVIGRVVSLTEAVNTRTLYRGQ